MKKIYFLVAFLISIVTFAQVPQGISYQAIALNSSGNPVVSSNIGIRLSVLDNSATGTVLYTETHTKTTNAQGLFNLVIGQGIPSIGTFSTINWGTNSKFLKVEMDVIGGTNYALVGTTQLLSVPYALYAGKVKSENVVGGNDISFGVFGINSNSFITSTNAYVFDRSNTAGPSPYNWFSTPISGIPFMKSANSFLTTTNAYIFGPTEYSTNPSSLSWHIFPITGQPVKIISNQFQTVVLTTTNAYSYSTSSSNNVFNWYPINISGSIIDVSVSNVGSCGIITSTNAYAFLNGGWQSTTIVGEPIKVRYTYGGILFLTSTNAYLYGLDNYDPNNGGIGNTYSWHNIPVSGNLLLD